jgi:hypothetical protein
MGFPDLGFETWETANAFFPHPQCLGASIPHAIQQSRQEFIRPMNSFGGRLFRVPTMSCFSDAKKELRSSDWDISPATLPRDGGRMNTHAGPVPKNGNPGFHGN